MSEKKNIQTQFLEAIWDFDLKKILNCIKRGANINYLDDENDETAFARLEFASKLKFDYSCFENEQQEKELEFEQLRKIEIMKHLLEKGADINLYANNSRSSTALYTAVCRAEVEMVRFLLNNGANPNLNFFPEESPQEISTVLAMARTDEFLNSYGQAPNLKTIIELLEANGAQGYKGENSK